MNYVIVVSCNSTFKAYLLFFIHASCHYGQRSVGAAVQVPDFALVSNTSRKTSSESTWRLKPVITIHPVCLPLCVALIHNKQVKCHQQAFVSLHMSAVRMSISSRQCSSARVLQRALHVSSGSKSVTLETRSVSDLCHWTPQLWCATFWHPPLLWFPHCSHVLWK